MIAYINLLTYVSDISWFQLLSCEVHYILIISLGFGLLVPLKQLTEKKKTTLRKFDYENNPLEAALKNHMCRSTLNYLKICYFGS